MNLSNKKLVLVGFGRENQAAYTWLQTQYPDAILGVADAKKFEDYNPAVKEMLKGNENLFLGADYLDNLQGFDYIVLSPGVNSRKPEIRVALQAGIKLTTATNLFYAHKKGKVIGVTGTKGKSTTASLIHAILQSAGVSTELIGNIGEPALAKINNLDENGWFVYELSSYMLETLEYKSDIAVFINFFPDHLDYHETLPAYFEAKCKICPSLEPDAPIVYNYNDEKLRDYFESKGITKFAYNNDQDRKIVDGKVIIDDQIIISQDEVPLLGEHNLENVLAAITVAKMLEIPLDKIRTAIIMFEPLPHRLQLVGTFKDIEFYNDAISTTPESTIAALKALEGKVDTIILGGTDRNYDFTGLAHYVLLQGINNVILLPATGAKIWETIKTVHQETPDLGDLPNSFTADSMAAVVEQAYKVTAPGKICLLSTASPSYGLFKSFIDKGTQFIDQVKKMSV